MSDIYEESLKKHEEWKGKIETKVRVDVSSKEALMLAYTPGVSRPCLEIQKDYEKSFSLTRRWNTVAVITDGTAVLGLGDIGPEAGMPVMEGKSALFKAFGNVDAYPICLRTKDTEEIIRTIYLISGSFGGINLEDISAPRCFEIERRLKEICDIPVFHDDQHGTAIITGAAIINALKVAKKEIDKVKIVINGSGAAGISIGRYLMDLGAKNVIFCDRHGILEKGQEGLNSEQEKLLEISNPEHIKGLLKDALVGADIFVGCSAPNIVTKDMIKSMADKAIVFPLANPVPEISHDDALEAGAYIIGTGSSKYPNQINNVLVFPGIFRGALDVCAKDITKEMMIAASRAIANSIPENELRPDYIIPLAFDENVHKKVAAAVAQAARDNGVLRK